MQPTILGIVVLPLSLIWASRPIRLLQLAFVAAIFEAAAAVVIGGSFGLPLAMVPGLLFIAFVVVQYALGMRYASEALVLRTMLPLLALLAYALISVMVLPDAFAGTIMVWPQRPDPIEYGFVPLAFGSGNVTQTLYLAMNVLIAVVAALFLTRIAVPYQSIMSAYLLGGYLVVAISFWQFASRVAHVPFPDDLIYSNTGWSIVEQTVGAVPRIQGPFSEPAGLAFYLSGLCFCCLWLSARGHRVMYPSVLLALASFAMLLSTSTTGIVSFAVGMPLLLTFAWIRADARSRSRIAKTVAMLVLGGFITLGPALVLQPALLDSIDDIVSSTVTKGESDSFAERTTIDAAAYATVSESYGLGVGWGSFRAFSLLPGLLANAGVFGLVAVLWMIGRIARLISRAARTAPAHPGRLLADGFSAAMCGQLAAAVLSAPTIGSLAFFLQLGCTVGVAARMVIEPRLTAAASLDARTAGPGGISMAVRRIPARMGFGT